MAISVSVVSAVSDSCVHMLEAINSSHKRSTASRLVSPGQCLTKCEICLQSPLLTFDLLDRQCHNCIILDICVESCHNYCMNY